MEKKWYLLIVQGDVEPTVVGPFDSNVIMENRAAQWRALYGKEDGLYGMQAVEKPAVWAFPAALFEEEEDDD